MTSAPAVIKAEGISKRYRIGALARTHDTLRDAVADAFQRSTSRLKNLSRKESAGDGQDGVTHILALDDVSFEIAEGEVVGLIGKNGSGKSTLLKILSRITEPTLGRAEIHGTLGSLLEVGTGFHPELTGRENVYLSGAILGMKKTEITRKFAEIVSFAELERFIDTPVKFYSSGMYVRLAFAVAAHLEPEILLVDEVLAVGDVAFQRKCLAKMGDAARGGRTVVFVTHNMTAVRNLCSRAMVLSEGRVVFSGDVSEAIDHYFRAAEQEFPPAVDTSSLPRPDALSRRQSLRILNIRFENGSDVALLRSGDDLELTIEFGVSEPLRDVAFGWSVHTGDDIRICEANSWSGDGRIRSIDPGRYEIRCSMKRNPLTPGTYSLHVGARCSERGLDYLPNVIFFRVELGERPEYPWLETASGFIRLETRWAQPSLSGHAMSTRSAHA